MQQECFVTVQILHTLIGLNIGCVSVATTMFGACTNLKSLGNSHIGKIGSVMQYMFQECHNLTDVPQMDTSSVTNMERAFEACNNLTDGAIQNIINMCLNSNITETSQKNLSPNNTSSVFVHTNITSSRYSNRLTELRNKGWSY